MTDRGSFAPQVQANDDKDLVEPKGRTIIYGGLHGGADRDILYGGHGNDYIDAFFDRQRDWLFCGNGTDEYGAEPIDYVSSSCETKLTGKPILD
jgi:hypothetical protein